MSSRLPKILLTSKLTLTETLHYDLIVTHVVTPNVSANPKLGFLAI